MSAPDSRMLELRNVFLKLNGGYLLEPVAFSVLPGQVVTVMGESGSGKSSLLAYLCGTLPAGLSAGGEVLIGGEDVTGLPPEARRIGILFQDDLLFPHLSVGQNLAFALSRRLRDKAARQARIESALAEAGLDGFANRDPATLSGGQRARVAVMRTLLSEPKVLLLDEPFSKLDSATRDRFRSFLFEHASDMGLPTLLVTHDPQDAAAAGGPILQLEDGILKDLGQVRGRPRLIAQNT